MTDTLGDRMKELERRPQAPQLSGHVCVRLDGRSFSSFTRGLPRPFDERLSMMMIDLTKALITETGARIGYTQSDEITLVLLDGSAYFGMRLQKIVSMTAAFASSWFARNLDARIPERAGRSALFDARVWAVDSLNDAAAVLLWRELDARKNAYTMAAAAKFSHHELLNKTGQEKVRMLSEEHGIDFDRYPAFFRRGTFLSRVEVSAPFTSAELDALPEKHAARTNPDLAVVRHVVRELDLPPLARVTNRAEALFFDAAPVTAASGAAVDHADG